MWRCRVGFLLVAVGLFGSWGSAAHAQTTAQASSHALMDFRWGVAPFIYRESDRAYVWGGYSRANGWNGGWLGGMAKLGGNFAENGFVIRGGYAAGSYEYWSTTYPNTHVSVENAELLLGYRYQVDRVWLTGWLGGAYEANRNPDPLASQSGTQGGVKVAGEIWFPITGNIDFYGSASYNTVFSTRAANLRVGYRLAPEITIGPEGRVETDKATLPGASGTREYRAGGFAGYSFPEQAWGKVAASLGGGQLFTNDHPNGAYLNVGLNLTFK